MTISRLTGLILLLGCLLATGCTLAIPREYLPPPLTNDTFADPVKVVAIPLPVIKTDPNEGVSLGALSAFLLHNRRDEIGTMIVPQVNYNKNFGTTFTLFSAFYPSPERRWQVGLSKSTRINEDYTVKYRDSTFLDRKLELRGDLFVFTDGSARFFGFQSKSRSSNETNYADEEQGFALSTGYWILWDLELVLGDRFRHVDIGRGAITSLPSINEKFTEEEVPGSRGFTTHAEQFALVYSRLDDRDMPTRGLYGKGLIELSTTALGSGADYRHYMLEVKGFLPLEGGRYVTASRFAYNQVLGDRVPFLERSILGGKYNLRGYGDNRFVDSSSIVLNIEERIRLFRYPVFNVNTDWEIAPFLDLGAVAENLLTASPRNFVANPGLGFRAVVRPNVVGRVDVGFGKEGPAVFATLGYPF